MLNTSVPIMELQPAPSNISCWSKTMLSFALGLLAPLGGVVIGPDVIVARAPSNLHELPFAFHLSNSSSKISCIIFANRGFDEATREKYMEMMMSTPPSCVTKKAYNTNDQNAYCVSNTSPLYPRDIMNAWTPFAELVRWLLYGKRAPVVVPQDPNNLIPRITHYVRFLGDKSKDKDMRFDHFLSVLSALYIGGFEHVYLHMNKAPHGRWWEELAGENVTVIPMDNFHSVFQQEIKVIQHVSDVARSVV